jgi:hypothetical protein
MQEYENYPVTGYVYPHVYELLHQNPQLKREPAIIFLINWPYGFGSALSIHMHNDFFLTNMNKKLTVLPHFSNHTRNFKYYDRRENNSFFHYFKYNGQVDMNQKIYFVNANIINNETKISYIIPVLKDDNNKRLISHFLQNYAPILDGSVKERLNCFAPFRVENKYELIGIHVRSIAQKHLENTEYLAIDLDTRLMHLKKKVATLHPNAVIFVATDVELYIKKMQKLFGEIHFLKDIKRIYNEADSVPQFEKYAGHILGRNIMDDCYALSLCDKVYISNSNMPFLITLMNSKVPMEEY